MNAVTYKHIFPLIKENKIWLGNGYPKEFVQPDGSILKFGNICWFTNLDFNKKHEKILLYKNYTPEEYPKYDTYDAIEVSKVVDIPKNYKGKMGVPITFLTKYNPDQFEILGLDVCMQDNKRPNTRFLLNGKEKYARIVIKHKDIKK
jgi:hypothetical protein